ncbi:hypothetical protein [Coralloluteibacterium thermophilus]|uniref:Uncharacterized protein n=1 Tax=Coralloluteibacterium thermophilum TaxID=2707049 RepID=A0ABV9NIC6_9GAMM
MFSTPLKTRVKVAMSAGLLLTALSLLYIPYNVEITRGNSSTSHNIGYSFVWSNVDICTDLKGRYRYSLTRCKVSPAITQIFLTGSAIILGALAICALLEIFSRKQPSKLD